MQRPFLSEIDDPDDTEERGSILLGGAGIFFMADQLMKLFLIDSA